MKEIRKAAEEHPELAVQFIDSVQPAKSLMENVTRQLVMNGKNLKVFPAAAKDDLERTLKVLEILDITNIDLKKKNIDDYPTLKNFLDSHCKSPV